jgi:DNA-binding MarR family transcriptional regulator
MNNKEQMVLTAMENAGKPLRPGEIAELTGIDKNEVSKIINSLKKAGKVTSPIRCCWAPAG